MYNYGLAEETASSLVKMGELFVGLTILMIIFSSIIGLITIISYAKIFTKAGKPWWASIIPIYNIIVMIEIAKLPMWYIALLFIPVAQIYAIFKINIEMSKKFGKSTEFGIGMTLLNIIFIPLLAFSNNKYEDNNGVTENKNNQFDANNVINDSVSTDNANINIMPMENISVEPASVEPAQIENISLEPASVEPAQIENISLEPASIEPAQIENISLEPASVEPAQIENISLEPTSIEPVPMEKEQSEETLNAFNILPDDQTNTSSVVSKVETVDFNEQIVQDKFNGNHTESELAVNVFDNKKLCKNCGNELPEIVSICPNCGTDNE